MVGAVKFMGRNSLKEDWLGDAIDAYYKEEVKAHWRKPKQLISPSMSWSVCPREIQIRLLGYQPRFSPQTRRRMDNGTLVHHRWEGVFQEMGIVVMEEKYMAGADIGGTPDNVVCRLKELADSPENMFLLEIKSINTNGWRKLPWAKAKDGVYRGAAFAPTNLAALAKAQPRHVTQWLAYDRILKENGHDIGRGFIFYECKDNQQYGYFFVVRDDPLFDSLSANSHEALEWNRRGDLLGMPFQKNSKQCKECDCQFICFREASGDDNLRKRIKERLKSTKKPGRMAKKGKR